MTQFLTTTSPAVFQTVYPQFIISSTMTGGLQWMDGTVMGLNDLDDPSKPHSVLDNPTLLDQIALPYPKEPALPGASIVGAREDPGRSRYMKLFKKMYGSTKEEVEAKLVMVPWMPRTFLNPVTGQPLYRLPITTVNGVDQKVAQVSALLDGMPADVKRFLGSPGSFYWRPIAGSDRLSAHSFGIAMDINPSMCNYWLWDYKDQHHIPRDAPVNEDDIPENQLPPYPKHTIPTAIIEAFEKFGFIWGGKWFAHYDTMHFEYRPELLCESIA